MTRLVDDHAFERRRFVGDDAEFGGGVALQDGDPAVCEVCAQRRRQRRAGDEATLDRGHVLARLLRRVEQDFEKIRRAGISGRLEMRDRLHLLLGVADAAGNDCAAERMRPRLENESAGRQVISESVVHDVARAKPGGKQRTRRIPPVLAVTLGLEDRAGRHQQALELARRGDGVTAERRLISLPLLEVRLAQHRHAGQRRARRHRLWVDAGKLLGPARRTHRARDQTRQVRELLALARFRRACLQGIVEVRHRVGHAALLQRLCRADFPRHCQARNSRPARARSNFDTKADLDHPIVLLRSCATPGVAAQPETAGLMSALRPAPARGQDQLAPPARFQPRARSP